MDAKETQWIASIQSADLQFNGYSSSITGCSTATLWSGMLRNRRVESGQCLFGSTMHSTHRRAEYPDGLNRGTAAKETEEPCLRF